MPLTFDIQATSVLLETLQLHSSANQVQKFIKLRTCKLYNTAHCVSNICTITHTHTHTHTRLTALCPGLPGWAGTRKAKPIWILLKQETVSGSGISWAVCKSAPAPRSRQITTPAPHRSVFTGRMPFLPPNQQCQSTEGKGVVYHWSLIYSGPTPLSLSIPCIPSTLVISDHNSFWVLFDKNFAVYFIWKIYYYFSTGKWLAQGTGTVPIVSAHFRSLLVRCANGQTNRQTQAHG